jgi:CubicO group peptidase (beta-lactamase class C family)
MTQATTEAPTQTALTADELTAKLAELATEFDVPGAAIGIHADGQDVVGVFGVTSVENPLPVDENTLFQFGSTGKTFTASAVMRLVEQGKVDLDAPVRTYVPELKLQDEEVARTVTVLHLLNHSAGWDGDHFEDTGRGDDALARYVETMATLRQVSPLGTQASYNNAAFVLAGRLIEKVTGKTYEDAIKELLIEPLGLRNTFAFMSDIMTRRFAAGHENRHDGSTIVARPWALPRSVAPAGGWSASVRDQLAWANFHLGDGRGSNGEQVLTRETLDRMKEPTFSLGGGAIGDFVGICWLIKDLDDTRLVGHGGSTNGQLSAFQMVPARGFAVTVLTNSAPNGAQLHEKLVEWSLERCLGVVKSEPEPLTLTPDQLQEYTGDFSAIGSTSHITIEEGALRVKIDLDPEVLAKIREMSESEPEQEPPFGIGLLADDKYIVTDGKAKGMRGFFTRDDAGQVSGINLGGRLATRVAAQAATAGAR